MNYIGLDVHKDYCQLAVLDNEGRLKTEERIPNDTRGYKRVLKHTRDGVSMVMEASSSFYTPYDYFSAKGFDVKVAHPKKVKAIAEAKVKTDKIDAKTLAKLLRADMVPESHIPDKRIRRLRDLIRHRQDLVKMSTESKNRIHSILIRHCIRHPFSDLYGKGGRKWLESIQVEPYVRMEIDTHLANIDHLARLVESAEQQIFEYEKVFPEVRLLCTMPGIGRMMALTIIAEIGDINRFGSEKELASYAGLVPSVHQSGDFDRRGRITKEGSSILSWAMVQATQNARRKETKVSRFHERIAGRHGTNKAKVALARKMLTWIYIMLKRGEEFAA